MVAREELTAPAAEEVLRPCPELLPSVPEAGQACVALASGGDDAAVDPERDGRWYVYLIECQDGSIYTGIAIDVAARYAVHAAGKGARYTRSHPPARLLASFEYPDRSSALKAEYQIKQLTAAAKRALAAEVSNPPLTIPTNVAAEKSAADPR